MHESKFPATCCVDCFFFCCVGEMFAVEMLLMMSFRSVCVCVCKSGANDWHRECVCVMRVQREGCSGLALALLPNAGQGQREGRGRDCSPTVREGKQSVTTGEEQNRKIICLQGETPARQQHRVEV